MKRVLIIPIVALGIAAFAASALAKDGHGRWDRMDANGDGEISAEEMDAHKAAFLEGADADGNGAVSKEEMQAFHEARRAEWKAKHNPDKNGDGVVDRTEYINAAQERFDRMDKDGDGVLSEDEQRRHHGKRRHGRR